MKNIWKEIYTLFLQDKKINVMNVKYFMREKNNIIA